MRGLLLALLVLALTTACGGDSDESVAPSTSASGECESVEAPEARDPGSNEAPTGPLAQGKTYTLTVDTNCGSFTLTLDTGLAPNTAASLVALANDGYFADTLFHRIVPRFVIQGGDPTQSGSGGPGYSTVDIPPSGAAYTKGTVAMAKSGVEAPGTAGSQFFVVTADDAGLPPEYAIVGEVTDGLDVVELIGTLGDAAEQPTQPVVISSVSVTES